MTPGINTEQAEKLDPSNAEQKLEKLQEKEYALTQVVARLPINEELYSNTLAELKVVAQERADAERDYLEIRLKSNPALVLGESDTEKRRIRIRQKLMKALETGEQGETRVEYHTYDGFYVSIDFVLNIHRYFDKVYITYQLISPLSEEQFPEVKTSPKPLEGGGAQSYRVAIGEKHRFYGVPANDNSYILFKFWVEETFVKYDPNEFDDLLKLKEEEDEEKPLLEEKRFVVYGWAPFKVFYKKKVV